MALLKRFILALFIVLAGPLLLKIGTRVYYQYMLQTVPMPDNEHVIMHAMGGIDGFIYTNSLDAFEYHYKRGRRLFEVDFSLSSDGELIAAHSNPLKKNRNEYRNEKLHDKYTPLDLNDVLRIMEKYDDIKIITDLKGPFKEMFAILAKGVMQNGPTLWERIIPQIYEEDNLNFIISYFPFRVVIYTLYRTDASNDMVYNFAARHDMVKIITVPMYRLSKSFSDSISILDKEVFVHTVNEERQIKELLLRGANGIYTDNY